MGKKGNEDQRQKPPSGHHGSGYRPGHGHSYPGQGAGGPGFGPGAPSGFGFGHAAGPAQNPFSGPVPGTGSGQMPGPGRGMGWGRGWRARMEGHFRSKGYRFTVPRQIIIEILQQNEDYLSADDLYLQVHDHQPGIGLATVYRTLQLLVEIGVVSRIETGEGKARYKMAAENERRRREVLICTSCFRTFPLQRVPESRRKLIEEIEKDIHTENNFEVRQSILQFYGICEDCAKNSQAHRKQNNT